MQSEFKLEEPTAENIKQYYQEKYMSAPNNFNTVNSAVCSLVYNYPSHSNIEDVLIKSVVINELYSTSIMDILKMARHIVNINPTTDIEKGNEDIVSKISKGHGIISSKTGREYTFYSFASKYCYNHNKGKFIIYDRNVRVILWEYIKEYSFSKLKQQELHEYQNYTTALKEFINKFDLGLVDLNLLDKFFWKQGEIFLKEKMRTSAIKKELKKEKSQII